MACADHPAADDVDELGIMGDEFSGGSDGFDEDELAEGESEEGEALVPSSSAQQRSAGTRGATWKARDVKRAHGRHV